MAGSRYAYVRDYELSDVALPNTFLVIRIDGKGFHKFSERHGFVKPNDPLALELMNEAARCVMQEFKGQITLAFGESDEYRLVSALPYLSNRDSFLIDRKSTLYNRRQSKLMTHVSSLFTAAYVFHWQRIMNRELQALPSFDGRVVAFPSETEVRDYFAWRQADTHINNLYNTVFWALIQQGGKSEREAYEILRGTVSSDKHEILFSQFGINYDKLPAFYRKGTTLVWATSQASAPNRNKPKTELRTLHVDIISDGFWQPIGGSHRSEETPVAFNGDIWESPERLQTEGMGALVFAR